MYIGLDIGTTTLSAVVLDTDSGALLAQQTTPNNAGAFPAPGRAELDIAQLQRSTIDATRPRSSLVRPSRAPSR